MSQSDFGAPASRRAFLKTLLGGLSLVATTASPVWAAVRRKFSKVYARYQYHPNRTQRSAVCVHFRGPRSCELVSGLIVPYGWCRFFRRRPQPKAAAPRRGTSQPQTAAPRSGY